MVPGKKNILSGGRHLIIWRPPLNLCGGRHLIKWMPPLNFSGSRHLIIGSYMKPKLVDTSV